MSTPIESRALWSLHREVRAKAQAAGACSRDSASLAFQATDKAEGKPPRVVELCERCNRLGTALVARPRSGRPRARKNK